MNARTFGILALLGAVGLGATACEDGTTSVEPETALLNVTPEGGAQDVNADSTSIAVTFEHAMHDHATDYMAVHEGDVTGPEVQGSWMTEESGTHMRFVPDAGLKDGTRYTLHLGGDMMDEDGNHVDLETHGTHMGGEWADGSMMHGGMMGGDHPHMGEDWQHPDNGSYGMVFTFTTTA